MMTGKSDAVKQEQVILSSEQKEKLKLFKIKTRIDNEKYFKSHPEIEILVGDFVRAVLQKRPSDVRVFAAEHFTNSDLQRHTVSTMDTSADLTEQTCPEQPNYE